MPSLHDVLGLADSSRRHHYCRQPRSRNKQRPRPCGAPTATGLWRYVVVRRPSAAGSPRPTKLWHPGFSTPRRGQCCGWRNTQPRDPVAWSSLATVWKKAAMTSRLSRASGTPGPRTCG